MSEGLEVQPESALAQEMRSIARGAGVAFIGNTCGRALGLVSALLLGRALGTEGFGTFQLAVSVVSVAAILAVLGVDTGLSRYLGIYRDRGDSAGIRGVVGSAFAVAGVGAALLCVLLYLFGAQAARSWFPRVVALAPLMPLVALAVPCVALAQVAAGAVRGFQDMGALVAITAGLQRGGLLVTAVVLWLAGLGVWAAGVGYLATNLASAVVGLWLVVRLVKRTTPAPLAWNLGPLLAYSTPLVLTTLLLFTEGYTDRFMIGIWCETAEVGRYTAAFAIAQVLSTVIAAVGMMFGPTAAKLHEAGARADLVALYKTTARWILLLIMPIGIVFISLSRPLLAVMGPGFTEGQAALAVLTVAILISDSTGCPGLLIMMSGRSVLETINTLVGAVASVALNIWLIPRYGILGAALGTGGALALLNILRTAQAWRLFGALPYRTDSWKPLLAGLLAWGTAAAVFGHWRLREGNWTVALSYAAVALLVYGAAIWRFGLSEHDRYVFDLVKRRLRGEGPEPAAGPAHTS